MLTKEGKVYLVSAIKDTVHPAREGKARGGARCQVQQLMAPTPGYGEAKKAMWLSNLLFPLPSLFSSLRLHPIG